MLANNEKWVPGLEGTHSADRLGRFFFHCKNGKKLERKIWKNHTIALTRDGVRLFYQAPSLLWEMFIGPIPPGKSIMRKYAQGDYSLNNLDAVSPSERMARTNVRHKSRAVIVTDLATGERTEYKGTRQAAEALGYSRNYLIQILNKTRSDATMRADGLRVRYAKKKEK